MYRKYKIHPLYDCIYLYASKRRRVCVFAWVSGQQRVDDSIRTIFAHIIYTAPFVCCRYTYVRVCVRCARSAPTVTCNHQQQQLINARCARTLSECAIAISLRVGRANISRDQIAQCVRACMHAISCPPYPQPSAHIIINISRIVHRRRGGPPQSLFRLLSLSCCEILSWIVLQRISRGRGATQQSSKMRLYLILFADGRLSALFPSNPPHPQKNLNPIRAQSRFHRHVACINVSISISLRASCGFCLVCR